MPILIHTETGKPQKFAHEIDYREALKNGYHVPSQDDVVVEEESPAARPLENTVLVESAQAAFEAEQAAREAAASGNGKGKK